MYDLLAALLSLFKTNLVDGATKYLSAVRLLDMDSKGILVKENMLPALIISANGERHTQGPMANTARETFGIHMYLIVRSHDTAAYLVEPIAGTSTVTNMFKLSDVIRDLLYKNKRLTNTTFEMTPTFQCNDFGILQEGVQIREIQIEYTKLELYTGMQNNQTSLDPAAYTFN